MNSEALYDLRKEYKYGILNEDEVSSNPVDQFSIWWQDVERSKIPEHNAMTLATAAQDGLPDARTVLLKGFNQAGFIFFTNYNSTKSKQLEANNKCCLLFYWKELERQVRINGYADKLSINESIRYFDTRPEESKLGAWASPQSLVIAGQSWLTETLQYYRERFKHGAIPKPPHWGGYRVIPEKMEFWQGRPGRMHDRILYVLNTRGLWDINRLAP